MAQGSKIRPRQTERPRMVWLSITAMARPSTSFMACTPPTRTIVFLIVAWKVDNFAK